MSLFGQGWGNVFAVTYLDVISTACLLMAGACRYSEQEAIQFTDVKHYVVVVHTL